MPKPSMTKQQKLEKRSKRRERRKQKQARQDAGATGPDLGPMPMSATPVTVEDLHAMSGMVTKGRADQFKNWMSDPVSSDARPAFQVARSAERASSMDLDPVIVAMGDGTRAVPASGIRAMMRDVPLKTRVSVESWFHEADVSKGERPCLNGRMCQGREVNNGTGFTLIEYPLVPQQTDTNGTRVAVGSPHMCMMCLCGSTAAASLQFKISHTEYPPDVKPAPFRVMCVPGEYSPKSVIVSSDKLFDGPLSPFPIYSLSGWSQTTREPRGPRYLVPPPQPNETADIFRSGRRQ